MAMTNLRSNNDQKNKIKESKDHSNINSGNNDDTEEDNNHLGRIRTYPHVNGNWAVHIHISVPFNNELLQVTSDILQVVHHDIANLQPIISLVTRPVPPVNDTDDFFGLNELDDSQNSDSNTLLPDTSTEEQLHISLSNTGVFLKAFQIDTFVIQLRKQLAYKQQFTIRYGHIAQRQNQENTRNFICLDVTSGTKQLQELVSYINKVMQQFRLPIYYQDPKFHTSIAWNVSTCKRKREDIPAVLPLLSQSTLEQLNQQFISRLKLYDIHVDRVHCLIGNKKFEILLRS